MKCCFVGHRDSVGIEEKIYTAIKKLIANDVTDFYSGGMGNFDKQCERIVKELGGKIIFIPYNMKCIKKEDKLWYDAIICPFGNKPYAKFDIPNRNRWLVDQSDIILSYVYRKSGAKTTLDYAIQMHKKILSLTDTIKIQNYNVCFLNSSKPNTNNQI